GGDWEERSGMDIKLSTLVLAHTGSRSTGNLCHPAYGGPDDWECLVSAFFGELFALAVASCRCATGTESPGYPLLG
ncbi:MAG: hypothetical protein KDA36_02810, partial [Planctomycetaceae bacterium]|nr:hypothetical protein [Planctomycetaceae bacterium]